MSDSTESQGVVTWEATRSLIAKALGELTPMYRAEVLLDQRRLIRMDGENSATIHVEPYFGVRTWIQFEAKLKESPIVGALDAAIRKNSPELFGYVGTPNGQALIQNVTSLIAVWCRRVLMQIAKGLSSEQAIEQCLIELSNLLKSGRGLQTRSVLLSGLKMPREQFDLAANLILRKVTATELAELSSHDIYQEPPFTFLNMRDVCVFEISRQVKVELSVNPEQWVVDHSDLQADQDLTHSLLRALYLSAPGRLSVLGNSAKLEPAVLPNMNIGGFKSLSVFPFAGMSLLEKDLNLFTHLFAQLQQSPRNEVAIACDRLMDAENRVSPVDSLLDSVIGLEALLNSKGDGELSFRLALNFAYLGEAEARKKRFDELRAIQNTRNKVVHGGFRMRPADIAECTQDALLARNSLRETIHRFILDPKFAGGVPINSEFWLNRVLTAN